MMTAGTDIEVSVVMPCLNEADTLTECVTKARKALRDHGIAGEVIVADNGSTDGSPELAVRAGARVVPVPARGYGSALMGGIEAAAGRFIIMGDADDSYDFSELYKFVEKLRQGHDIVMGCRLPAGGGTVRRQAMPFLHRWIGNPLLSWLATRMYRAPIHDVYCGLRGFTRALYGRLDLHCVGMEFATEMVIKSSLLGVSFAEVPITLHPDGRRAHAPHLKTLSDGWRTLRLFMLYSPRYLYLIPGLVLVALGLIGYALSLPPCTLFGVTLGAHTLLVSSLVILVGYQAVLFGVMAKIFAIRDRLLPEDPRFLALFTTITLERGLLVSVVLVLFGILLIGRVAVGWWQGGFGPLDYYRTMRLLVPGVTLCALGSQSVMGSFFASILGMRRR